MVTQSLSTVETAAEAFARYQEFRAHDQLIQADWHSTADDGRQLACALGMLGENVNSPSDCPARIMPRWLANRVSYFFDYQKKHDALVWGEAFYAALARIDGKVPFSVVHDWHANTVCPLAIDVATKRARDVDPHLALQELHKRALIGEKISADEWKPVLRSAYAYVYADAYSYAYADAYADAIAYADADANADADAYADAIAYADADANADAYADDDANAAACKLLAEGMVAALNRVEVLS
jgi:hypothetical protein